MKRRIPKDRRFKFEIGQKVMWDEFDCTVIYREKTDDQEPRYKLVNNRTDKPLFSMPFESKLTAQ